MDSYENYLFLISDKLKTVTLYDLEQHQIIGKENRSAHDELSPSGSIIYHCNQSSFGKNKWVKEDTFPILYVSQRSLSDQRCFMTGLRIKPQYNKERQISSFSTECVQIVLFPPMTDSNALGNVNGVFDKKNNKLITYSRNNNRESPNYLKCRITEFNFSYAPVDTIELKESDIINSYEIGCSAWYMQGASIYEDKLNIGHGGPSQKYTNVQVVDLKQQALQLTYNLRSNGVRWEPEGVAIYKESFLMYGAKNIYLFSNIFELTSQLANDSN